MKKVKLLLFFLLHWQEEVAFLYKRVLAYIPLAFQYVNTRISKSQPSKPIQGLVFLKNVSKRQMGYLNLDLKQTTSVKRR